MPAIPDRPVALQAMSDAAVTAAAAAYDSRMIGASPYYNGGYTATGYGMYGSSAQNCYPVSTSLRGSAAPFPFAATSQTYYGNGYSPAGFDYSPYPTPVQCYGSRSGYYGSAINSVSSTSSLYAMSSLPSESCSAIQLSPFSSKNDSKKTGKGAKKKKVSGGSSSPDGHYTRVFIWEMEDVCLLSSFPYRTSAVDSVRIQRVHTVNSNVDRIVASMFGVDQNDECDHMNIEDVSVDDSLNEIGYQQAGSETSVSSAPSGSAVLISQPMGRGGVDWMRKLAAKYQHIKDTYALYKNNFSGLMEQIGISADRSDLLGIRPEMGPGVQAWMESVGRCLKLIVERSSTEHYANVLITGESIVCTLAKLLFMEQSSTIPAENVYSTAKSGKEAVIDRILSRFGKKCSFVIISTRADTHEIAKKENIPLWKVKNIRDLELFHLALSHHLLS